MMNTSVIFLFHRNGCVVMLTGKYQIHRSHFMIQQSKKLLTEKGVVQSECVFHMWWRIGAITVSFM